ncbi:MarR family transcriptional regulator [Peribacillus cavernae]|uniref:MarR family transcriptional regulator n=1 Tax=Peribacillus cavernae TaxID=1674310 RepID=A0A3S0VJ83_9BACI|nr:MarR family transcriptional regulator [Peribacillus cavernae]RUQ26009.1 MarR family transcriptional regulator [Peribacillus cavernae]
MHSLNEDWTDIYYFLHYDHKENLTHQNIRCLQTIEKNSKVTVQAVTNRMGISHNTASEHIKRLIQKGYIKKYKGEKDKRVVYLELTALGKGALEKNTELDKEKLKIILEKLNEEQCSQIYNAFELLKKAAKHEFPR